MTPQISAHFLQRVAEKLGSKVVAEAYAHDSLYFLRGTASVRIAKDFSKLSSR